MSTIENTINNLSNLLNSKDSKIDKKQVIELIAELRNISLKPNLAKAIISVMKKVKGMEKNSNVGTGNHSYKGTKDQDVKEVFNEALSNAGLCIMPIDYEEEIQIDRWEDAITYKNTGQTVIKQKQSVFTKVKAKYLLLHESGESQVIAGYGHGVDSQDKGAGKATTYSLKNALLYTFLTPVGKIDDADGEHSEEIPVVPENKAQEPILNEEKQKPILNEKSDNWKTVLGYIKKGVLTDIDKQLKTKFTISKEVEDKIKSLMNGN